MIFGFPRPRKLHRFELVLGAGLVLLGIGCASASPPSAPLAESDAETGSTGSTDSTGSTGWRYALVIDASSSASTLHIFEWMPAIDSRLPRIEAAPRTGSPGAKAAGEGWEKRVKTGLDSYRGRPNEAAASLEPLIEYALDKIGGDPATLARTSVLVRATAGMRLLEASHQAEILSSIDRYLESTPFGSTSTRVISGAEEGLYGWITVNYILGHLEHGGRFPTVGALDLGGASTQITFQPLDFPKRLAETITLGSNTYHLYTKSYLGLGQDRARETVASPACFLVGYPTPQGPGTGDFEACRTAIHEALTVACPEDEQSCSMFGSYQPPLYGDFLALSVYAYTADFFGLRERMRPEDLEVAGREFCSRNWQRWLADEPEVADNPYLPLYCYAAVHVVTLLTDGFGFPADTDRISAPLKVQGSAIGWTLGALLYELAGSA